MDTCLVVPGMATVSMHKFMNRSKEKRVARFTYQWHLMEKDRHISGVNCS
ncbi:NADH dehydrogenase [ubiquinone] 1 alpha subcomplex subunit 1-like [Tupaia chinensis]|nr:NADH dehydrogenase [ubiquinone] 1 alpha subcomplex subunit 1-like [Tupaia chinensis]